MTDLVQRLRAMNSDTIGPEAADHIWLLDRQLDMTEDAVRMSKMRIERQDTAIRQLREALLRCKHEAGVPEHVYKTAKAALAATENLT